LVAGAGQELLAEMEIADDEDVRGARHAAAADRAAADGPRMVVLRLRSSWHARSSVRQETGSHGGRLAESARSTQRSERRPAARLRAAILRAPCPAARLRRELERAEDGATISRTRDIWSSDVTQLVFILLLAASLAFFARTTWLFGRAVAAGAPDP